MGMFGVISHIFKSCLVDFKAGRMYRQLESLIFNVSFGPVLHNLNHKIRYMQNYFWRPLLHFPY